jgi:hypothetical protein
MESISGDEFLDKKRDYSPLLVHLTRSNDSMTAKGVLIAILDERKLVAFNHYCLYSPALEQQSDTLQNFFKVVCFTETPIDQIQVLLNKVRGRKIQLEQYGLVFKKDFIRNHGGNHVFYTTKDIAYPLWSLYKPDNTPPMTCKLLALVTLCDDNIDFHWEREWRVVGNLVFNLKDIYCGLCPAEEIDEFEQRYPTVKFISPHWGINKILDALVGK